MEYLAKITGEQKDGNFLKYDFVDLKTGKESWFYHSQKLNYISIYAGRLKLLWYEEQQAKFLQSFEQDLNSYFEGAQIEKALTKTFNKSNQVIEELENEKIKLSRQQIIEWEGQGLIQKKIAKLTGHCERTIRYWKNPTYKSKLKGGKRGRPRKMNEDAQAVLYLDFLNNNAKKQKERVKLVHKEKQIEVSQQVVSYNI
jgi:transposase